MNKEYADKNTIKNLLCQIISRDDISDNIRLLSDGVMESMDLFSLITDLEEKYEVLIPPEKISKEHFDTLDDITKLVVLLQSMKE